MKIVFILPDLRAGGAEKVCINLATDWVAKGHYVKFILMNKKGEYLKNISKKIKIVSLKKKKLRQIFFPLLTFFRNDKPDAILAQMWPLTSITVLAWLASFKTGKLFLVDHVHLSSSVEKEIFFPKKIFKLIIKLTYLFSNKIIVVSNGVKKDLVEISNKLNKKIKVIYNPLIKKKKLKIKNKKSLKIKIWGKNIKYRILSVGSLKIQKDHFNLIEAFSLLKFQKECRLLIIGNGPLKNKLKKFIKIKRLENEIIFIDFKSDLQIYYETADLFVSSSKWEGFSNVIAESLGCGLPVVSTDCKSGPSEILKRGRYGELVPIENSKKLALAIEKNLHKKHDKNLLKKRSQDFAISKISNKYLKLIKNER